MEEKEAGGMREVLCVLGVGWTNAAEEYRQADSYWRRGRSLESRIATLRDC